MLKDLKKFQSMETKVSNSFAPVQKWKSKANPFDHIYIPTEEQKILVRELSAVGMSIGDIAPRITEHGVSENNLALAFEDEISAGRSEFKAELAKTIYDKAIKEGDTKVLIYLAKVHLGWIEQDRKRMQHGDKERESQDKVWTDVITATGVDSSNEREIIEAIKKERIDDAKFMEIKPHDQENNPSIINTGEVFDVENDS